MCFRSNKNMVVDNKGMAIGQLSQKQTQMELGSLEKGKKKGEREIIAQLFVF